VPQDAQLWVGHSFGGRLLLELAHRHPERVDRGVLLDPALWVPPSYALEQAEAARFDRSFASVEEAVSMRLVDGTVHRAPRELLEEDFAAHLAQGEDGRFRPRFSRSCVIGLWSEMSRVPPQQRLEVPLLLARAVQADVCPPVLVEAYRETVGELLETTELPGGHIVFWDALEETGAAIEAFLGSHPRP
jgi:pimeloyl-ACP methyl ester carboxylesterase